MREGVRSGGVSVYVAEHISTRAIPQFTFVDQTIEICTVELSLNNQKTNIVGIYRPHGGTVDNFTCSLGSILSGAVKDKSTILTGDFNINLLVEDNSTSSFVNLMHSYHFLPLISKPTRLPPNNHQSASLLDHIWFNRLNSHSSGIVIFDFTDHLPTFVNFPSLNIKINEKIKIQFRCEDDVGKLRFNKLLSEFNWNSVVSNDVDIYTQSFVDKINEFYVKSFPLKTKYISCKQHANPWLNKNISKLIKLKSLYFNMYKRGIISKEENNSY